MNNPLISIVMVNYNQEKYLQEAIESVLFQSYQNWELIIVDDGSTDSSVEIIKKYQDDRIRPFYLERNRHICYATNLGLDKVRGEFIARLDSDDAWKADKLEKQIRFIEENPEIEVCFTRLDLIDEDGNNVNDKLPELYQLYNSRQKTRADWIRFFFFVGNSLIQSTMLFKTSLMKEVGKFNLAYMQSHDFDFFVRLIQKTDFYFIEEPLTRYRRTTEQNSSLHPEKDRRFFNEHMNIRNHFFEEFPKELFVETFQEFFLNPEAASEEELKCEQAFLLTKCIGWSDTNPVLGMIELEKLMRDEKYRDILENKYHFTPKDFYRLNGKEQYWSAYEKNQSQILENEIEQLKQENAAQKDHIEVLLALKDSQQREIENMRASLSWKVTKPLRGVKKRLPKC